MTTNNKKLIKTRKHGELYWVYFLELRKIISVKSKGEKILNLFFNKDLTIKEIALKLKITEREIKSFLKKIKNNLYLSNKNTKNINNDFLDIPTSTELQIISKCNLRCKHCFQDDYQKIMPLKTIKKDLNILDKAGIFEIELTGGEPFLHPNILEIINFCCKKPSFSLNITTNGTFLNEENISSILCFNNIVSFLVSLDGTKDVNDKIRGKGIFKKVDSALRILKKNNFYTEISFTVNKLNIENVREIIDYARSLRIPLNINLFKPFNKEQEKMSISPKEYFDLIDKLFIKEKLHKRGVNLNNNGILSYISDNIKTRVCRATISNLNIDVNNKMIPCPLLCLANGCNEKKIPEFDEDFLTKWKQNTCFKDFRKGNFYNCQASSYIFNKNIREKDPYSLDSYIKYQKSKTL